MEYTNKCSLPAVTAECTVITNEPSPKVLMIQRGEILFNGAWIFPGWYMNIDEMTEEYAICELKKESDLKAQTIHQIGVYSKVVHAPCGRTNDNFERIPSRERDKS